MAVMCFPLCYLAEPQERRVLWTVVTAAVIPAVGGGGASGVIVDVISLNFQIGETEAQGKS